MPSITACLQALNKLYFTEENIAFCLEKDKDLIIQIFQESFRILYPSLAASAPTVLLVKKKQQDPHKVCIDVFTGEQTSAVNFIKRQDVEDVRAFYQAFSTSFLLSTQELKESAPRTRDQAVQTDSLSTPMQRILPRQDKAKEEIGYDF